MHKKYSLEMTFITFDMKLALHEILKYIYNVKLKLQHETVLCILKARNVLVAQIYRIYQWKLIRIHSNSECMQHQVISALFYTMFGKAIGYSF